MAFVTTIVTRRSELSNSTKSARHQTIVFDDSAVAACRKGSDQDARCPGKYYVARTRHEDEPDSVHRLDIPLLLAAVVRIPGQARRRQAALPMLSFRVTAPSSWASSPPSISHTHLQRQSVMDHACSIKKKWIMHCPYAGGR